MVLYIGKSWNEILQEFQKGFNQIVYSYNIVWLQLLRYTYLLILITLYKL